MFDHKGINERAFEYYASLRRVRAYVRSNYPGELSLEHVSRVAAMQKTYFSSFFHRRVGVRFKESLRWIRVTEAIRLIGADDRSLTDVAFATGFRDLRTFERAFKWCTGQTARAYKRTVLP